MAHASLTLDISSEPGKGSTFLIVFPAARVRFLEPARDPRAQRDAEVAPAAVEADTR